MALVPITPESHDVDLALAYATAQNITGRPLYRRAVCYLQEEAAQLLARAALLAAAQGLRLRLFDAFRPVEAQWRLWQQDPNPEFVADPRRGSPHSRGVAVDLTLIDKESGAALEMGTPFDDLTPAAHHGRTDIPVPAQRHRALLLGLMSAAGWDFYQAEWWHYQLFAPRRYPLLGDRAIPGGMMQPAEGGSS